MISRGHEAGTERLSGTRTLIGLVSDIGGAAAAASMLVAIVAGTATTVVGLTREQPDVVLVGGAFTAGVVVGAACMYVLETRRSSSVESQLGYRWVKATYTYVVDADDPHVHRQKTDVVIRAIRDGVRTFSNQYRWSGSGDEPEPTVMSTGHTLAGPIERLQAWRRYDVRLEPFLRKGDTATVELLQQLRDSDEQFELFLAKTVYEPMERLHLRVELPARLTPDMAWCEIQVGGAGPQAPLVDRHLVSPSLRNGVAHLDWEVQRPTLGRSYRLRWSYASAGSFYEEDASGRPPESMRDGRPRAS